MDDTMLLGILVVIAIAFIIQAFRKLPSFTFRLGDSSKKNEQKEKKPPVVHTTIKQGAANSGEASSVDDEYRFNFRSARWGMSREQVKRSDDFTHPESEDSTRVTYSSRLGHMDCKVTFIMSVNDMLIGGRYDFTTVYEDGARYLSDFETMLDLYIKRFGNPVLTEIEWNNRTFEKKKEFHSIAFMEGHFTRSIQWQTERTDVILYLANNEGIIDFHIDYKCLDHTPLTPQEAPPSLIETPHDDEAPQQEQGEEPRPVEPA